MSSLVDGNTPLLDIDFLKTKVVHKMKLYPDNECIITGFQDDFFLGLRIEIHSFFLLLI